MLSKIRPYLVAAAVSAMLAPSAMADVLPPGGTPAAPVDNGEVIQRPGGNFADIVDTPAPPVDNGEVIQQPGANVGDIIPPAVDPVVADEGCTFLGAGIPVVKFQNLKVTESNTPKTPQNKSGIREVFVKVTISPAPTSPILVRWVTANGSATGGSDNRDGADYLYSHGRVVIKPGQTEATVHIQIFGDTLAEGDEDFFLDYEIDGGGACAEPDGGHILIKNDD